MLLEYILVSKLMVILVGTGKECRERGWEKGVEMEGRYLEKHSCSSRTSLSIRPPSLVVPIVRSIL